MTLALFDCSLPEAVTRQLDPIWRSGRLATGGSVAELEERLSGYLDGRPVVALSDMTQALALALWSAGVGPGDEVATLALNCMSSNTAIAMVGATPRWVDVDSETGSVDLADLATCIGPRTRAVVIYHLAGYVGDLDRVRELCDAADVPLIEDANNALGARWHDRRIGTIGDYAVFSFYANRQLNGIEGAALVCPDQASAESTRKQRRFGIDTARFRTPDGEIDPALDVAQVGIAASLTNVNAALACLAMDDLEERLDRNRSHVAQLREILSEVPGLRFVDECAGARGVFWVALVRSERRDALMAALKDRGIPCSKLHYRNDRYSGFGAIARELPGTDMLEREMLALPSGWWLAADDLERIAAAVRSATVAVGE